MNNRIHEIRWITPLIIGGISFFCCVYALVVEQRSDWNLIVLTLISAAFIGAGIFNSISLTPTGIIIETAQANLHGLSTLETAVTRNAEALQQLT